VRSARRERLLFSRENQVRLAALRAPPTGTTEDSCDARAPTHPRCFTPAALHRRRTLVPARLARRGPGRRSGGGWRTAGWMDVDCCRWADKRRDPLAWNVGFFPCFEFVLFEGPGSGTGSRPVMRSVQGQAGHTRPPGEAPRLPRLAYPTRVRDSGAATGHRAPGKPATTGSLPGRFPPDSGIGLNRVRRGRFKHRDLSAEARAARLFSAYT